MRQAQAPWAVLRLWDSEIEADLDGCVDRIEAMLRADDADRHGAVIDLVGARVDPPPGTGGARI